MEWGIPATIALLLVTASNALGLGWVAFRGRDARLGATSDAAYHVAIESQAKVEALASRAAGDRLEHLRQVEELTNLVADIARTRQSADAAVGRRERKERQVEPPEESGTERERSIAHARRHFAQAG